MKPSRVKAFNPENEEKWGTQFEIDGKKITGVKSVDFHISEEEAPRFTFEMYGMPDIEILGNVQFEFTPKTVQEAVKIILNEYTYSSGYFKALVSSVEERLRIHIPDQTDAFRKTLAEDIVKRILWI